jgi:hypothetical protein
VVVLAVAVGLLVATGWLLSMARGAAVTKAAIAATPLVVGWFIVSAPPRKRVVHPLELAPFGLTIGLGVYVLPLALVSRVMLENLLWYGTMKGYGLVKYQELGTTVKPPLARRGVSVHTSKLATS